MYRSAVGVRSSNRTQVFFFYLLRSLMQSIRNFIGFGLIAAVFCAVTGDPIVVVDPVKPKCDKPNTEYKEICQTQPTCDKPLADGAAIECVTGCYCMDGFVLSATGNCVTPTDCPKVECPQNQTFKQCAQVCHKNCETQYLKLAYKCRCQPACECDEGYIDDSYGNCIQPEDCDPAIVKCPSGKVYNKCQSSVETCNGPILYKRCPAGCFCPDGMVLNDNEECISKEDCPTQEIKEEVCPANQIYKECSLCGRSCENEYINIMFKCACVAGCACEEGYIWQNNEVKRCIKPEHCTKEDTKCQDTQYFSYSEIRKTCNKPHGNGIITAGCFCNEGLLYNEDTRTCVKASECPNAQCGPRQGYQECYKNVVRTCNNYQSQKVRDVEEIECKTGCFCTGPYIWDEENQKCVDPMECPKSRQNKICERDDPRTEFRTCQSSTRPTCTEPNPTIFLEDCRNECRCKEGFVFNEALEKCMTLEECAEFGTTKNSCGMNSTYSACASACPRTCKTAYTNQGKSPTCMACYDGCACNDGYFRTKTNRCVLLKDCPDKEIKCPSNREYRKCESFIKTCDNYSVPMENTCLRGCFCKRPLVEDKNGNCVKLSKCRNVS